MNNIIKEMVKKLKEENDLNGFREIAIKNRNILDNVNDEEKKELVNAYNEYFVNVIPQEYKDNPHIHYEVRKKR